MSVEIFYRCNCGFKTFFASAINSHLDEGRDDVFEHKVRSVIVEKCDDAIDTDELRFDPSEFE